VQSSPAHRALVALALVALLVPRPAITQGFNFGSGIADITGYQDVCVPALVVVTWDDGTTITWDDGTIVTQLQYPTPTSRVLWDDGSPLNWDDDTNVVTFQQCGPSVPAVVVTWDSNTPQLLWDDGTVIVSLGGYIPPLSPVRVYWDGNSTRLLWDDGTLITGF
jgi:hypothetical protein